MNNIFWVNIQKLMGLHKVTQGKLATAMGRRQGALSAIMAGKNPTFFKDMEKAAEFFGYTVADLLDENFVQIMTREQRFVSEMNGRLSQPVPITEKEKRLLQELNVPDNQVLKLHRIFLIRAFPPSKQNLQQFVIDNQIGTIVTTHGGEDVFAFQIPNRSMEPVCTEGSILVFDAHVNIKDGDFVGLLYKGIPFFRKLYYRENSLILNPISDQDTPEIIDLKFIDTCFRIVECVKKM